ncbi:MAG: RecX family transcriptional regulator [Muribaculaceae bacterium]|nr:RecX family transcriptional regulator [Muribaculaceae bacterium]
MTKKPVSKEKALSRLETLCSRSEQCENDLNRKMILWGVSSDSRREIIGILKANKFLDDSRFALSYAHDKAKFSAWGPYKIKAELIRRKISSTDIKNSLASIDSSIWKAGLIKCAVAKTKGMILTGEEGFENGRKVFRYLISRGFPSAASSRIINFLKRKQIEAT